MERGKYRKREIQEKRRKHGENKDREVKFRKNGEQEGKLGENVTYEKIRTEGEIENMMKEIIY